MSLESAYPTLQTALKGCFTNAVRNANERGYDSDTVCKLLGQDMANAIHAYVTAAMVITDPGQVVVTAVIGALGPGVGNGATAFSGTGKLT